MKKLLGVFLSIALMISITACSTVGESSATSESSAPPVASSQESPSGNEASNVLIAYFSVPENSPIDGVDAIASASIVVQESKALGSTQFVAETIAQTIGGDLFRIKTPEPYPLEHEALVDNAAEDLDTDARPVLSSRVENFDQYEVILLGFPNWWGDMPMPVYSFLEEYDFGAKTIIPFITHGGSGASSTLKAISQLQPGALLRDNALVISRDNVAGSEQDVADWAQSLGLNTQTALPDGAESSVRSATVTPMEQQILYLWEENNAPATTAYTVNNGNYTDEPDFRPTITTFPVPDGTPIKGAVLICAGGAFQFRSDQYEGIPVADDLSRLGYQSFVVDYRLRPYTQEEGALDLARALRFVRAHASEYGIEENDIAVMGFSAGGILAGEMLLNFDGLVNGTALDTSYVPDELDTVSADAAADGMIYSFYGRLSVGYTDVEQLRSGDLPPTFYCYGTRDPFYSQFLANAEAAESAGVMVERLQLDDMPHGFGNQGGWIPDYDQFLTRVFAAA